MLVLVLSWHPETMPHSNLDSLSLCVAFKNILHDRVSGPQFRHGRLLATKSALRFFLESAARLHFHVGATSRKRSQLKVRFIRTGRIAQGRNPLQEELQEKMQEPSKLVISPFAHLHALSAFPGDLDEDGS